MVDQAACGVAVGVAVVLLLFVIYFSQDTLEQTEYGLDFGRIRYELGDQTYSNGRHWIGFGHHFIKFPSRQVQLDFQEASTPERRGPPLQSRTSDGLEVLLEISFAYQLPFANVEQIYKKFSIDYEQPYAVYAIDTITRTATNYSAATFFANRTLVADAINKELTQRFKEDGLCELPFFQLLTVSLPSDFESAIQLTEVRRQDIDKAESERLTNQVAGETLVRRAQLQRRTLINVAEGIANATAFNVTSYVAQFNISQGLQAASFAKVFDILGKDEQRLIDYINVRTMRDHPGHKTLINVPRKNLSTTS